MSFIMTSLCRLHVVLVSLLLLSTGGSADAFPSLSVKWTDLSNHAAPIVPPRSGHVAFTVTDEPTKPRIFGGYVEEEDDSGNIERHVVNDMWCWDGVSNGWSRVEQNAEGGAEIPRPRLAAAAALCRGNPVLFGGWDPQVPGTGGEILDTLNEFDPKCNCWKTIDARIPGGPSSRHIALSLLSGDVLVHNHRCNNHVLIYSAVQQLPYHGRFTKQPTTGNAPSSRGLHAAAMAGTKALIFGGAAQDGQMSNEAFLLDAETWEWKDIVVEDGPIPCPRASPCLCTLSENCALLFGGAEATASGLNPRADVWVLYFDPESATGRWELLIDDNGGGVDNTPPGCPPPRNAATLSEIEYIEQYFDEPAFDGEERKCFVLQGGWAPFQKTFNDVFVLSTSLREF